MRSGEDNSNLRLLIELKENFKRAVAAGDNDLHKFARKRAGREAGRGRIDIGDAKQLSMVYPSVNGAMGG